MVNLSRRNTDKRFNKLIIEKRKNGTIFLAHSLLISEIKKIIMLPVIAGNRVRL